MKEALSARLRSLKADYAAGQERLKQLEAKERDLKLVLTRIEGAVQVLEEELAKAAE